jgi:disulfide bond formation protein DsbB
VSTVLSSTGGTDGSEPKAEVGRCRTVLGLAATSLERFPLALKLAQSSGRVRHQSWRRSVMRITLIFAAAWGSLALLAAAFMFQALGYPPCPMCWWQRYPHFAAIAIGALGLFTDGPAIPILGACAALTTAGLGVMHTGVERGWWDIQTTCSGGNLDGLSGADLLSPDALGITRCDEAAWELFGLSMASWNAVISAVLALIWILAARASGRPEARHPL